MMPPQQSPRAQLFPSSCRIGQRTEKLHSPWTRARARTDCSAHALSTKNTHSGSICLLRCVECAGGRRRTASVITNPAFRDESSTACAALCVHAPQPKCQTEAGGARPTPLLLPSAGHIQRHGHQKIYYLSLHLNLSFAPSTRNQSRTEKTNPPRRTCVIPKCKSSRQHFSLSNGAE